MILLGSLAFQIARKVEILRREFKIWRKLIPKNVITNVHHLKPKLANIQNQLTYDPFNSNLSERKDSSAGK